MLKKVKQLIVMYHDILAYMLFGVLTTAVNCLIYLPCYNLLGWKAVVSNAVAWVGAVAVAYLTNKPFVFHSHDWSVKTVIPELTKFVGCRVASGVTETAILFVTVDLFGWNGVVWKLITNVLVVVLNYIGSKLLVFRKK